MEYDPACNTHRDQGARSESSSKMSPLIQDLSGSGLYPNESVIGRRFSRTGLVGADPWTQIKVCQCFRSRNTCSYLNGLLAESDSLSRRIIDVGWTEAEEGCGEGLAGGGSPLFRRKSFVGLISGYCYEPKI